MTSAPVTQRSDRRPRRRSSDVAAFLSFLWPGLGQWYVGRQRSALIFAVPVLVAVLALVVWLSGGIDRALVNMLAPSVSITFVVVVLAEGLLRIVSIVHAAFLAAGPPSSGRRAVRVAAPAIALGLVVAVTHLWAASVGWSIREASDRVFEPPPPVAVSPGQSAAPTPSDPFVATPAATPATAASRVTILITGIDASERRDTTLTDTLIVLSVDPTTGQTTMISFPRDIARFQLWDGRSYTGKINSLLAYANNHPEQFPDGGLPTLIHELGFLLGVPIHYYAAIDLTGFTALVDAVGGVTVDNPKAIDDPTYTGWSDGRTGFVLSAGVHELDGETALAYARSRKGVGDNDFTRARRQQQLLVALRDRLTDPAIVLKLPSIISTASRLVRTNFPRERVDEMLTMAKSIGSDKISSRYVLGPPYSENPPAGTPGGYQLILDMDAIAKLSVKLFGSDSAYHTAP